MTDSSINFQLNLQGSHWQRYFLTLAHALAIASVWLSPWSIGIVSIMSMILIVSAMLAWRQSRYPKINQIHSDGETWTLVTRYQQTKTGKLLPSTWTSRWLTLLHFRLQNGRFLAVPVWRDSVSDEEYRQLRVILRWQIKF